MKTYQNEPAVVLLSGGQDSTTTLFVALERHDKVSAVCVDYGQRHRREISAALALAAMVGVQLEIVRLPEAVLHAASPLVRLCDPVPQYPDASSLPGGLERTFVPMRNQLFLTIAANRAYARGARYVYAGVCEEDYGGYPDCRRAFIDAFENVSTLGTFTGEDGAPAGLKVETPLMYLTKRQTVLLSLENGAYEFLAFTHTSYDGEYPPTKNNHASLLRARGFDQAGVPDPLVLRAFMEHARNGYRLPLSPAYTLPALRKYAPLAGFNVGDLLSLCVEVEGSTFREGAA